MKQHCLRTTRAATLLRCVPSLQTFEGIKPATVMKKSPAGAGAWTGGGECALHPHMALRHHPPLGPVLPTHPEVTTARHAPALPWATAPS